MRSSELRRVRIKNQFHEITCDLYHFPFPILFTLFKDRNKGELMGTQVPFGKITNSP